jgi:hypothetical protein
VEGSIFEVKSFETQETEEQLLQQKSNSISHIRTALADGFEGTYTYPCIITEPVFKYFRSNAFILHDK